MDPLQRAVHLVGVLRARAGERPDHPIYTFLRDGEGDAEELTLAGLDVRARAVGAELQRLGIGDEPVLLLVPSGLDFAAAFFGCLYAGAIAVPAYPPRPNRPDSRLQAIARDARPRAVLTTAALLPRLAASAQSMEELREARWIAVDALDGGLAEAWREPTLDSSSLAFLQYTSGSTSNPRGVRVSHGNLLANEEAIGRAFAQSEESVVVSWLPLFHDMGLIGGLLQSLWSGGRSVLMTPAAFLQKPLRWLAAISRYRATTSGGPNFAYELCAERIGEAERANLDLAAWSVAFNGAEPVHAGTLARFAAAFAPCGFRRQAFLPCYGLAEATLFVAGGRLTEPPVVVRVEAAALERSRAVESTDPEVPGRELVGCGAAAEAHQVSVVDLGSLRPSPPGRVGEIWVAGPSVAAGYWHRPAEQADPFGARLAGGEARFLRTGDLGFQLGGELFITGRIKDLIILRGRNHYPQDLERTAERAHPAVRAGCGAAFPVESRGEERLVIVCELERTAGREAAAALDAIRQAVAEEHEVQVHDVVLVRTGTVPKTSSGKIRRHACRDLYLAEGLVVVARSAFAAEVAARDVVPEPAAAPGRTALAILPLAERCAALETYLRSRAARALRRPVAAVDPAQPLAALGLDSLAAIELQHAVETDLGVELDLEELFAEANVAGLAAGLAQAMEREATPARIPPLAGEEEAEIPLSHGQEGLWFQSRLAPESAAHQVAAAARVPGLDSAALRRAFEALVDRHAVLRSTFVERAGEPVQRIAARAEVAFQIEDAHGWTDQEVEARLAREAWRPFDLENGPPLRIAVFERSGGPSDERPDGEGVLVLALHHLVCDFWSLAVLARELGELYRQETGGAGADLPPLPATWGGWVRRQRQLLAGPEGERLWGFWRQRLAGELPDLELLTDRPRNEPGDPEGRAGTVTLRVGEAEAAALRALARGRRATLNMALLALFEVVLHRWTGQEDLLIGSPAAGRSAPELAPLVGYFANPVVLRADLSGDPSLVEILDRARGTALAALAHQGFPFPVLVERLRPSRDPGRPPLVQAVLALQRAHLASQEGLAAFALGLPGSRMELGGLVLEPLALARPSTEFELTLLCADLDGGLAFTLEHRAALFDSATMARLLGHLGALLAAVDRPEVPAADLPILTVAEREQLAAWNRTTTAEPVPGACIHELVAAQAARQPSALAIAYGERRLRYGELDGWANRIARALRAKGVGPEAVVAICLERSPELVAGALAVLKAGGAYLPLDPAQPPERLAFFLADAGARWVLTRESLAPCLTGAAAERLLLDREGFESESAGSLAAGVLPGNLAYLIYTSGSTGVPKGTELSHAGLANLVAWHRRAYAPGPDDRAALVAGVGFDASVWEMWPYLAAGASLWVPPEETVLEPAGLLRWLAAGAITHAFLPTPLAELVLGEPPPAGLALRWLLTGGDRLHRRPAPGSPYTLVNHYGPTESTVVTSAGEVPPAGEEHRPPAIGWPIDHLRVWLLDAAFGPVPVGVAGELCVGGVGLARGYLRRPEMTAEKFVPDPMATAEGERLYRTGDLARRLPDGSLEFLGRVDQQVKVRGFRIELGEIEATLLRQPGVRAAAVLALGQRLVGYVVAEGEEPRTADLRRELGLWLPEPMVPAAFVVLPALPLTPSGKVDRLALAQIEPERETATALETPRTPVEDLLVGIFQQVLEVEAVGIQDGFFDLGGHSLLATRVVSRVRQTFGVELPLRELFEAPTVAGLGERIAAALRAGGEPAPPLLAGSLDGPLPLSYAQERLWFLDRLEPGSAAYNMPAAFRLEGLLAEEALERAFTEIVRRHVVLRTRFVEVEGQPTQVIDPTPAFGLRKIDLAALPVAWRERELARLAREEAAGPFDLARGPLLRVGFVRLGKEDHGLLVTLHHIASDGWSVGVLAREVADLYGASEHSEHSSLPELPVQYADYARWQRQWLQGEVLEERLGWWRQRLAGAPALL
ncbi:MAG TPA: amino acid adenylation domain-containing protein, partial [Thermoanaerobaculia bacterium]|nr:amino acid adenylation domain-containing protein [Thermoanaerobaculia bacterium]